MEIAGVVSAALALGPCLLLLAAFCLSQPGGSGAGPAWARFHLLSLASLVCSVAAAFAAARGPQAWNWLEVTPIGMALAILVQVLGAVIGRFSARYLEGEPGQGRFIAALAGMLAAVNLLLVANHWLLLIAAWALVGACLRHLLCFYPERPFAMLAAHKKQLADRVADGLLLGAAATAWWQVGDGSISALAAHVQDQGMSPALQASAVLLVLAVILRTALFPVHGWLVQVMEAPTPVSALLHAGVVNLGSFVLIRFAPLLEHSTAARGLLVAFGLGTAVLAGVVMLTRISIKVRLAWSTVAQMGFMVLECGLGLYTLAALHLIGHSLYKAHAFLSASSAVRQARLDGLHSPEPPALASLWLAPALAVASVSAMTWALGAQAWPAWWTLVLGLAWAPLLWLPRADARATALQCSAGLLMVLGLTVAALLGHLLPLGLQDDPHHGLAPLVVAAALALYAGIAWLQSHARALDRWRRWSYAGFYVDEFFTRLTLRVWPTRWTEVR